MISTEATLVKHALLTHSLETPLIDNTLSVDEKYQRINGYMTDVIENMRLNFGDDSLNEMPHHIAKRYMDKIFSSLEYHSPEISVIDIQISIEEIDKYQLC